ncbi:galactokinase [Runella slithyformis]|uniref:Galactokinase n=1 Tax=Runella slithyformis (strain ATCC 29530 / DSM 19594 / LMG 11500 / NCIMB 11436 / LSU 4) TaxID=761193 RepID=A0A7U4E847_RUNSL|nr:galactokinase [Runella slithyformis]AEI50879.1 galactokinase [Runella slithyformis DSM 19594]
MLANTYPEKITDAFVHVFGKNPSFAVRAPGRINLIGEHTDYNNGFVLPAAIDKAIYLAIAPRTDRLCKLYAVDLDDAYEFSVDKLEKSPKSWANYLIGIISELAGDGHLVGNGFEVAFGGDVPNGAGLSSSAAVESGMGFGLSHLFDWKVNRLELALAAQRTEHNFAGVKCGIMDMFASIHGKAGSVIRLDCRDLSYEYFPFDLTHYKIVLSNSGVKHTLADSSYNTRRQECEQGVEVLKSFYPGIESLRDVSPVQVETHRADLPDNVYRRCRYVTGEIERVLAACEDLDKGDLAAFGQKMYATHDGLSKDYEVSCEELDFLVDFARQLPTEEVLGSRLMGGGFGGCTISIVKVEAIDRFIKAMESAYFGRYQRKLATYVVTITNGVEIAV